MAPHGPRARLDADERVILDILQRIDGVIADHPGDRPGIEQGQRQTLPAVDRDPADERAPTEHQAEPRLRPPGDALHERIGGDERRSEEHTSELQSLMRISYAVFCLKKKKHTKILSHKNIKASAT